VNARALQQNAEPVLDRVKFEQAILYFLEHAANEHLAKTKLVKLLYHADFDHFEQYDAPITGAYYRKYEHGPFPEDAWETLERMEADHRIAFKQDDVYMRHERMEDCDESVFSETEIAVLRRVAAEMLPYTAKQMSDATHEEAPWRAVKFKEHIPYYLAYYRNKFGEMELDEDELILEDEEEARAALG